MFQNNVLRSFSFHMEIDKGILNFSKGRNRIYYWCFCANDKNNTRCRTGSNLCHALSGFVIYWCKVLLIESNCDKVNDFDKILKWQCFKGFNNNSYASLERCLPLASTVSRRYVISTRTSIQIKDLVLSNQCLWYDEHESVKHQTNDVNKRKLHDTWLSFNEGN